MTSHAYHLDYETFSVIDLKAVNAYRYAEDDSTEILMLAISRSDSVDVFLWLPPQWRHVAPHQSDQAERLIAEMRDDPDALLWAHNAQFERAVGLYKDGPLAFMRDRPHSWRCTAALCRKANLPDSLEKAAEYLQLEDKKDARGKSLIRKFSRLQSRGKLKGKRVLPSDEPQAFAEFCEYCKQDVRAEKAIHAKLKPFTLQGLALDTFLLDIEVNDRGIPVNVPALQNAQKIIDEVESTKFAEFRELVGLNPTQKQKFKAWLAERGLRLDDMQGDTIEAEVAAYRGDPEAVAFKALLLYADLNYSAVKKVTAMLAHANRDGRVRGTLLYHGASTGRWAGRGIQPQNFKKPTIKNTGLAYEMIRDGYKIEEIEFLFAPSMEVVSSCIRHFIDAGEPILDADYAAVEARIVCWLAGQQDALQRFRLYDETGDPAHESYRVMAGLIFGKPPASIGKDSQERQLGKTTILGCGFNMGIPKFLATCHAWGLTWVTQPLAEKAVTGYRALHGDVRRLWYASDDAARKAILSPGRRFKAGDKLAFVCRRVAGILFLFLELPSGRSLAYPEPKIECDADDPQRSQITYYGQRPSTVILGRVKTYGGKLVENATQAFAADCIARGTYEALKRGYEVFGLIHDQALSHKKAGQTVEEFSTLLTTLPAWADGLPIKAEGKITPYYRK